MYFILLLSDILYRLILILYLTFFSPLEIISTSLWASLYHHLPVLSVFSYVSCQFVFVHIFSVVVNPSPSRLPPSSLPRYDHVHHFFLIGCLLLFS